MTYDIYENGEKINSIVASPTFVEGYCADNGYTYELVPDVEPEPELSDWDLMANAISEGVNSI